VNSDFGVPWDSPAREVAREIVDYKGDPTNERMAELTAILDAKVAEANSQLARRPVRGGPLRPLGPAADG
jgi:hypothetical protein